MGRDQVVVTVVVENASTFCMSTSGDQQISGGYAMVTGSGHLTLGLNGEAGDRWPHVNPREHDQV